MEPNLLIPVQLTPAGLNDAEMLLARLRHLVDCSPLSTGPSVPVAETNPAVRLFEHLGPRSTSRRLLEVLPAEPGATPAELGKLMRADEPLSAASVRAVLRNLGRAERTLRDRRLIDRPVVVKNWRGYADEGAGRYGLAFEQREALDRRLGASS